MIFQTRFNKYVDENNIEVTEQEKMLYLQEGGTIVLTDFNLPEDEILMNSIHFRNVLGDYFGTVSQPKTGALTFDMTGAIAGGIAVVYYNNEILDMPTPWILKGDPFVANEINKIYLERDSEGNITANILNFAEGEPPVSPPAPVTEMTLTEGVVGEADPPEPVTEMTLTEGTF